MKAYSWLACIGLAVASMLTGEDPNVWIAASLVITAMK